MSESGTFIGQQLGPYQVQSLLGAGGMGEVYRARDSRLRRDVAIKILPRGFVDDADRRHRFEREAQMLASLNHPNIAAIYGVEEPTEPGQHGLALVLELVDGETLAERLARGPLARSEALHVARQIVDALDAAHEKGIVHRDLKPANVKMTTDGVVKVLDFGLAKVFGPAEAGPHAKGLGQASTLTLAETRDGVILGTVAYMSPEQARGEPVDKRTDIWAFGCVLYELLTARPAFPGASISDTIAAVIAREPDWSALPKHTSSSLRRLLQRCLDKDPRRRLRDIGDARAELDDTPGPPPEATNVSTLAPARRSVLLWSSVVVAGVATAVAAFLALRPPLRTEPTEIRFDLVRPAVSGAHMAFSPDGRTLAIAPRFEAPEPLVLRRLDSLDVRTLPGTEGATFPFWSPDGTAIGFFAERKLKRIDLAGEAIEVIADAALGRGAVWHSDGTIFFVPGISSPIYRVPWRGGEPVAVTRIEAGQNDHRAPQILPGGRHLLYYARGTPQARGVYVAQIDGQQPRRLLDAQAAAVHASSGHLIFPREGQLLAQRFAVSTLALEGEPFKIADAVTVNAGVSLATLAASSEGALAFGIGAGIGSVGRSQLTWFDRSGAKVGTIGDPETVPSGNPALSPDGAHVALNRAVAGNWDVWVIDAARGVMTRVTSEPVLDFTPVWSADGTRIIFQSNRQAESADLFSRPANAVGDEAIVLNSAQSKSPTDVSRDGRFLLFTSTETATNSDVWALPLDGSGKPQVLVRTSFSEGGAQFSPDGRSVAYMSNETGRSEIYVQPFPGPGARARVSTDGGAHVRWAHSGKELFYLAPDRRLMRVLVTSPGASGAPSIGQPSPLFTTSLDPVLYGMRQPFAVSPDDQRFLMITSLEPPAPSSIVVVLNWKGNSPDRR